MSTSKASLIRWIEGAFFFYAAAILSSQAGMSIGAAILGASALGVWVASRGQLPPPGIEVPKFKLYVEL